MSDEISQAQSQLGKAIETVRAGEDRALAQQVRELGEHFGRMLNALLRLTSIHSPENHAFDQPTTEVERSMARLYDLLGPLRLVCVEGQVYLNDIRVRFDERFAVVTELAEHLARHGSGGLTFQAPLADPQIRRLIPTLSGPPGAPDPRPALQARLNEQGLAGVLVLGFFRLKMAGEVVHQASEVDVKKSISRAKSLVTNAWDNLAAGRVPNPLPLRKVVNELVDAATAGDLLSSDQDMVEFGASPYADHVRRVATLAVIIGLEIGLPASSVADLGVAAMFHDVGYASRDEAGQPPGFTDHPLEGLRILLRQRGFHAAKVRRLLAVAHHHRPFHSPGAPPVLYGRILRIADDFETLTRPREGRSLLSPAEALRRMAAASGTAYDPVLLQAFINRLGRYPPGTVLRLQDGRLVVSTSGARSPELFERPMCRVVLEVDGRPPAQMYPLDLAEEGHVVGEVTV